MNKLMTVLIKGCKGVRMVDIQGLYLLLLCPPRCSSTSFIIFFNIAKDPVQCERIYPIGHLKHYLSHHLIELVCIFESLVMRICRVKKLNL